MLFFHSVPSANTLVRWVNEDALASIVQARPCSPFANRFIVGQPHRLWPGYLSSCPSDSISRWTPCPPEDYILRPTTHYRRLGNDASHSSAIGTSTVLNNALLSTHFASV